MRTNPDSPKAIHGLLPKDRVPFKPFALRRVTAVLIFLTTLLLEGV
jgi:hypothetical protein